MESCDATSSVSVLLKDLRCLKSNEQVEVLSSLNRIERRTFPTTEAYNFDASLLKKPNVVMTFGTIQGYQSPVAYAMYVRYKDQALLHKVCIAESHRGQGIGRHLMQHLLRTMTRQGCQKVILWVDQSRTPARCLYKAFNFCEVERVKDYYGQGRTGIKMRLSLDPQVRLAALPVA